MLKLEENPIRYLPQYAEELFDELPEAKDKKNRVDFMFAGNVGALQSVETIVEAARLLQQEEGIHIHIVGGGIALENCRKLAEGLKNITFHGRHELSEMPAFYAMADAMLITMKDDPVLASTLPGKVQTYMAAGKPVVGAIGGETAVVVNREARCGICCAPEDAAALAEAIRKLSADDGLRARYGENARRYYQDNFRKAYFFATLERILQENCV